MASLYGRTIFQLSRRAFSTSLLRQKKKLPGALELATGLERQELLALQAGDDDPFNMKPIKRGENGRGTKDNPNLVPSAFDSRMIGCVCEPDSTHIVWMWLHEGHPKRCECGHWFKLIRKQKLQIDY